MTRREHFEQAGRELKDRVKGRASGCAKPRRGSLLCKSIMLLGVVAVAVCGTASAEKSPVPAAWKGRGIEVEAPSPSEVARFCDFVGRTLAPAGVNTIFLRFSERGGFLFKSHPECSPTNTLGSADVLAIREACRRAGVKIVPVACSLGHHSENDGVVRGGVLAAHPELDEARGGRIDYCFRMLCPKHPGSFRITVEMLDDIVEAFGPDAINIACDEVTGIGTCDRCRDTPKAKLFADWVNSVSRHLKAKGVTTMIWGDRLIDHRTSPYDIWESSDSGTAGALELLDRDIVICDWHYRETPPYPSVKRFVEAGFRIWACVVRFEKAARMFLEAAERDGGDKVEGVMYTNWLRCDRMMNAYEGCRFLDHEDPADRGPEVARLAARTFHMLFPGAPREWDFYEGTELPTEGRCAVKGKGGWTWYDRLVDGLAEDVPPAVGRMQADTAGVCFRFRTDSDRLLIDWTPLEKCLHMWHMPSTGASGVDVYQQDPERGWRMVKPPWPSPVSAGGSRYVWKIEPNLPTCVYAPLYNGLRTFTVGVKPGSSIGPVPHASGVTKPVVVYGTSTTQGGCVSHPGVCPTSVAGRIADVPVINLGFSGSGRMEPGLLKRLADVDASCYVLNTVGNMNAALLKERFEKFTRDLMAKRPGVPVLVVTDCFILDDEHAARNDFLRAMVARLKAEDPVKFARLSLACDDDPELADVENTVEGVHFSDLGAKRWGTDLGKAVKAALSSAAE